MTVDETVVDETGVDKLGINLYLEWERNEFFSYIPSVSTVISLFHLSWMWGAHSSQERVY